jgi:hypothetical protein
MVPSDRFGQPCHVPPYVGLADQHAQLGTVL